MELMTHQDATVQWLVTRGSPGSALLTLPPRMGKTVVTIRAAHARGRGSILVLAPLTLLGQWKREVETWWPGESGGRATIYHGEAPRGRTNGWTLTNYETFARFAFDWTKRRNGQYSRRWNNRWPRLWDLVIVDESLLVKNRNSMRSQALRGLRLANRVAPFWLLSGNPASRYLDDLYNQLYLVDRDLAGESYWDFAGRYCIVEQDEWGLHILRDREDGAERLLRDFQHAMWSPPDLPLLTPIRQEVRHIPMTAEQAVLYRDMERDFLIQLSDLPGDTLIAPNVLAQTVRLLQLASSPRLLSLAPDGAKWEAAVSAGDWLRKPMVVWTAFTETVRALSDHYRAAGWRVQSLTGANSALERERIVSDLRDGEMDILVAHPGVGKYGLDLSAANSVLTVERTWDADASYQASQRVRNLKRTEVVQTLDLVATDGPRATIDGAIYRLLQQREGRTIRLTAGRVLAAYREALAAQEMGQ